MTNVAKTRDEQIIEALTRLEERQESIHKDIVAIRTCKSKLEERIIALEQRNTYINGALAVIIFLITSGRLYDLIMYLSNGGK